MILNNKDREELQQEIIDQTRDGIVLVEREELEYTSSTDSYLLKGAGSGTVSLINVISVEGVDSNGFYRHPTETFQNISAWASGTNYILSGSVSTVAPDSAGLLAGTTLYDYFVWQGSELPKDASKFYVTYRYFDENKVVNPERPTSFADGSIAGAFASAFSTLISNVYNELNNSHRQSFLQTSSGEDTDLHAENYGIKRRKASASSGTVEILNYTTDDLIITSAYRFTTQGVNKVVFKPVTTPTIPASGAGGVGIGFVSVQSTQTGFNQNVGVNTITKIYSDVSLTQEQSTSDYTVSNPGLISGLSNLFSNGSNAESDEALINRTQNTINKRGNATKYAIESAITNLQTISDAKVFEWEDKKSIATGNFQLFIVGESDKVILDPSIITEVNNELRDVKPVSTKPSIQTPMGIYTDIEGTIGIERQFYSERPTINTLVSNAITAYMAGLSVGQDILYSKIIEEAMKIPKVRNYTIDKIRASEYAFHPYDPSTVFAMYASGTDFPIAQQFTKMAKGFKDVYLWDTTNPITVSGSQISGEVTPSVFIAIQDVNGEWTRDPQYAIDWYSSNGTNTITIDINAGSGAGVFLTSGSDYLLFDYESYENHVMDFAKVQVSGTDIVSGSITMSIAIYSGASEPTTQLATGTFEAVNGLAEYRVDYTEFTLASGTNDFWLVISGTNLNGSSGTVYAVFEDSQRIPHGAPTNMYYSGASWNNLPQPYRYMQVVVGNTFTTNVDIEVTGVADKSEIAILADLTNTNAVYTGDEL